MTTTRPEKKLAEILSRKYNLSLDALYKGRQESERLEASNFMVKEIAPGYIPIFSEEQPPISEVEDFEDFEDDRPIILVDSTQR
ncbi:MAG TPA: hypothetical protein VKB86_08000 [Pyrinomonadaceae bacterium]|nr:hypothetical protein [Pyrinomonadaceae bacterium]